MFYPEYSGYFCDLRCVISSTHFYSWNSYITGFELNRDRENKSHARMPLGFTKKLQRFSNSFSYGALLVCLQQQIQGIFF